MNKFLFLLLICLCAGGCGGDEVNEIEEEIPVSFVSVGGCLPTGPITITFDGEPKDVTVNAGTVKVSGRIATITGPFTPGHALTITWTDGTQTLHHNVPSPCY